MKQRLLVVLRVLPVVIAAAWLAPVLAQGASSAPWAGAPAQTWKTPRTPDGQPDLQGFWTNSTYTPLERPGNVTKEFYKKEEAAEIEKRAAAQESEQTEPGTIADVHYDFSQFG